MEDAKKPEKEGSSQDSGAVAETLPDFSEYYKADPRPEDTRLISDCSSPESHYSSMERAPQQAANAPEESSETTHGKCTLASGEKLCENRASDIIGDGAEDNCDKSIAGETQYSEDSEMVPVSDKLPEEIPAGETSPGIGTDHEIEDKIQAFMQEFDKDENEFARLECRYGNWQTMYADFLEALQDLTVAAKEIVQSRSITGSESIPETLIQAFRNSEAGVRLILKMLENLPARVPKLADKVVEGEFRADPAELRGLNVEDSKQLLNDMTFHNYALVTSARKAVDNASDSFFSLLRAQFFTILDGIFDGKKHWEETSLSLRELQPAPPVSMDGWFAMYDELAKESNKVLQRIQVQVIAPKTGDDVDYELHDPFDVTPGEKDDTVQEVVRVGFKYVGNLRGETDYVIRPAQVVVVKSREV